MSTRDMHQMAENLLQQVVAGDDAAFEELYRLVHRRVYYYLLRMLGCRETAEDVLVETFTAVWKNSAQYAANASVLSWMLGIARNLALNEIRRRKIHEDIDDHPHIAGGEIPDMAHKDQSRILKTAMAMISKKHREIIDLVFYQELNYPEISKLMDIPVGTVKTRVFHAKAALKTALREIRVGRDDI